MKILGKFSDAFESLSTFYPTFALASSPPLPEVRVHDVLNFSDIKAKKEKQMSECRGGY